MTQQDQTDAKQGPVVDRTGTGRQGGSIGMVLMIAACLVGAGVGLVLAGRTNGEPYILALLGVLATVGVFLLFALAAGILRLSGGEGGSPLLKAVVDRATNGILIADVDGRVVYANSAYLDLTGAKSANEVRPIERVFVGDPSASEVIYRLLKAAREGRRHQDEVRIGAQKGKPARWLILRVRPLGERKNERKLNVWSIADVTRERQRQENAFVELQNAIDYLDHAPAGFFSIDADAGIAYLNATLAEWLDHDIAEIGAEKMKLSDIVAGEGAALLTTLTGAPGEVKTEVLDIDLKTKTGRTLPVRLLHKVPFGADGAAGPSRTLVLNRAHDDGSDPQRAAEVRFVRFFHHTPMAIATVDKDGKIARNNAMFASLFSRVTKGESAHNRSIVSVVAQRDRPALEAALRKAGEGQGEIAPVDAMLDGEGERWAQFYVTSVDEQEGDQETAIVYALDTTERRELERRVSQKEKMETIGQLASNVAHDLNNILGGIMMANDFLINAHRPTDPSFQDIMQIRQNANRAASLVRHLLAFSRKQTLRPQVIDLGEALSDLSVLLKRLIGDKVTLVGPQLGRDLWPVKADLGQFEQAIINIAINARDAMPDGGRLTLRTANIGAEESATLQKKEMPIGEYVLVEAADTGTGIPPEARDKIFDPFYTTKEIGKGTGLGLATVYGFIKQSGGFIYFDSEVGRGTTFRIFIPRYVPAADDVRAPDLPQTTSPALAGVISAAEDARRVATDLTGQGTILLVEDEDTLRVLNARGLTSRGYHVVEAANGVEAIERLEELGGHVDLVVSDVVMPEMNGPKLFHELRKRNPAIKMIFVSGYAEDAFEDDMPDPDTFDFLAKPFTLKQLVERVKETMAK